MPVGAGGDFVDQVSAIKAWAQAAHDILVEVAAERRTIDYQALSRQVQKRSGVQTNQPASKWVGPLLGIVARQCQASQLPLLTALVVRRDGSVGPAYDEILRFARIPALVDQDPEEHAEQQRQACYSRYRGSAPAAPVAPQRAVVVGKAAPVRAAAAKASSTRPARPEPLQGSICPTCFMQRSLTGECANCD